MSECSFFRYCKKNTVCHRCVNQSLLDLPPKYKYLKPTTNRGSFDHYEANKEDSWKDLEQQVANDLNYRPSIEQARRSRRSGAMWFETGDVVDKILHPECKERSGEKSFAVQREWLEKAKQECDGTSKTMCLPFRFKGDSNIYTIFDNNDIMSLIQLMKTYMEDNDRLRAELEVLKKKD